jgi:hypothetical protein
MSAAGEARGAVRLGRFVARALALAAMVAAGPLVAQEAAEAESASDWVGEIAPLSGFTGQMSMTMETEVPEDMAVEEVIRFEPWQMLDDLFRSDIVLLMRAGPTDWEARDAADAGAQDCGDQRLLTEAGEDQMRQLGALLVVNGLKPGEILMGEWCRAQQTYINLETGMVDADKSAMAGMAVDLSPALNPLGAANGAADVEGLREAILGWDGGEEDGPLLVITDFENIAELTRFNVYEGEMLIVDPKRDGRVLGYLRLASAVPDLVYFPEDVVAFAQRRQSAE